MMAAFGGHAMAAGLSLPESYFPDFQHKFAALVDDMIDRLAARGYLERRRAVTAGYDTGNRWFAA